MQVAKTILEQLGGQRFVAMTGVTNLGATENSLSMKLKRSNSKANYLTITLMPTDVYKMEFIKIDRNFNRVVVKEYNEVYCDMLQELFTEETGMYTRL